MASNIKKAGTALRKSFRQRRYLSLELDENNYIDASPQGRFRKTKGDSSSNAASQNNGTETSTKRSTLKRGANMTQSMREAVGTIRQVDLDLYCPIPLFAFKILAFV